MMPPRPLLASVRLPRAGFYTLGRNSLKKRIEERLNHFAVYAEYLPNKSLLLCVVAEGPLSGTIWVDRCASVPGETHKDLTRTESNQDLSQRITTD